MSIGRLLWYIYVLPLVPLVLSVIAALALWTWLRRPLRRRMDREGLWQGAALALFLLWAASVIYITLLRRGEGNGEIILTPFWSYREVLSGRNRELLRADLMNVLLFLPGGLALGELAPAHWRRKKLALALVLGMVLSVFVEAMQALFQLGLAETDDVIHNTLGCLLGSLPAALTPVCRGRGGKTP